MSEKPYKLDRLEDISGGDNAFIKEMIDIFLGDVDSNIKNFEQYYKEEKLDDIAKLAHKIKPTVDLLGIEKIHQEIRDLRTEAEKGDANDQVFDLIQKVKVAMMEAAEALRKDF